MRAMRRKIRTANRKGAKAQKKAAKNLGFEFGFPLRPFAPLRLCGYRFY
jgi:hypothetical protein